MLETKGDRLSRYAEQVAALSLSEAKHGAGDAAAMIRTLDSLHLAGIDPQPKAWAIPNFAPAAEVTLFTGAGSAGKSLLAQQLCSAMAAGIPTLGLTMEQAPSIYIICEDEPAQLHWRQEHICRALGVPMASLAGKFLAANLRGEFDNALAIEGPEGFEPNPTYHRLARLVRDARAKLVALDNIAHLFIRNENDRGEVTRFVDLLNRLAGESGGYSFDRPS